MDFYEILAPKSQGNFTDQLEDLSRQLSELQSHAGQAGRRLDYVRIFLSDIQNQHQLLIESELFQNVLSTLSTTIVEQPPLNGSKIGILVKTTSRADNCIFQSIRLTEEETHGTSAYFQTVMLFEKYLRSIQEKGLDIRTHLVRTWIYVADIDINYDGIVKARNDIFRRYGLTADTHYIASTGIGGSSPARSATVAIDFLTYPDIREEDKKYLQALDHLNPTHEYGVASNAAHASPFPTSRLHSSPERQASTDMAMSSISATWRNRLSGCSTISRPCSRTAECAWRTSTISSSICVILRTTPSSAGT